MDPEQFCLKWGNHPSNMLESFGDLLSNESLCDVTIACDGFSLKAHKLVLSAASLFFRNLFLENPSTHPIVILADLKYVDMKALVEFMYHGQVSVPENQISTILKAAENLKIKGLGDFSTQSKNAVNLKDNSSKSFETLKKTGQCEGRLDPDDAVPALNENGSGEAESDLTHSSSETERTIEQNEQCSDDVETDLFIPAKLMEQMMTTDGDFEEEPMSTETGDYESDSKDTGHLTEDSTKETSNSTVSSLPCSFKGVTIHRLTPQEKSVSSYSDAGSPGCSFGLDSTKRGRKAGSRLCVFCKHIFTSESEFEKHMADHRNNPNFVDTDLSTPTEVFISGVPSPNANDKSVLKMPLTCSTCKYTMNTLSDAQSHLSTNPVCRTSQFKCVVCPKIFIWPATLIKHFREQHEGPGGSTRLTQRAWFFCEVCKKPLLSKHALSLHRSKFHGLTPHSSSHDCSESFNSKRGRKQGTRVCRLCKRTFVGSTDYFSHIQTYHKNINLSDSASEDQLCINESLSSIENESNSAQSIT